MEQIVTGCKDCMFLGNDMGRMECHHPYWKTDEGISIVSENPYEYCIITQDIIWDGGTPIECPLSKNPITITKKQ